MRLEAGKQLMRENKDEDSNRDKCTMDKTYFKQHNYWTLTRLGIERKGTLNLYDYVGFEPRIFGFIDKHLIHWAMVS